MRGRVHVVLIGVVLAAATFAGCDDGKTASVVAPRPIGDTSVATVAQGRSPNLVVIVVNNSPSRADIAVDLNGARAINHAFAGFEGGSSHASVYTFEFQVAPEPIRIEVRAQDRSASAEVDLGRRPRQWVVVQNYETDDLGVQVSTYDERPLFG